VRRNRRDAEQQIRSARQEVGRRVDDAHASAGSAYRRVESGARNLA
jgi:hypothetical protein